MPYDPVRDTRGLVRRSGGAEHRARAARVRSGALCLGLCAALLLAATPEWLHHAWTWTRHDATAALPLVPAEILLRAAEAAEARGDSEEALRLYRTFDEQHPDHPGSENAMAQTVRLSLALGDLDAAHARQRELRLRWPHSSLQRPLLREVAEVEFAQGRLEDAMRSYKDLVGLAIRPDPPAAHEDGVPQTSAARAAQRAHDRKLEEERNEVERLARFNLALCQEKTRHPAAAIRAYERFVRRFPTDKRVAEAQYRLGALHLELGHLQQARRHFEPLCDRPDIPPVLRAASIYHAGRCSEKLKELDEARRLYQMATPLQPLQDDYRLASLQRLARLLEKPEPMRAREVYRDLAANSTHSVRRAIARQRFVALQGEATVAALETAQEVPE